MARITESRCRYHICKELQSYIESHTLREILDFIKTHGTIEEDDDEVDCFIPAHEHDFVEGKTYDMGKDFHYDEFVITTDGRLFFTPTLRDRIEILDDRDYLRKTMQQAREHFGELIIKDPSLEDGDLENMFTNICLFEDGQIEESEENVKLVLSGAEMILHYKG